MPYWSTWHYRGALVNNSSCRGNSISNLLVSAKVVLNDGSVRTLRHEDFQYGFRTSVFKKHEIIGTIVSATLKVKHDNAAKLQQIADKNSYDRTERLERHARNLGCTVNRCYSNGQMALWLRFALFINGLYAKLFVKTEADRRSQRRDLICKLTGYKTIAPYVSSKNPIIFMWLDEGADLAFPLYIEFMRKVYKTDKIEIEIIS